MDRFMVVSADCHATATPDGYTEYLEDRYRDAYAEYRGHVAAIMEVFDKGAEDGGRLFSSEAVAEYKDSDAVASDVAGGTPGQWDSSLRAKELEADGVVGEVLFPNGSPFMGAFGGSPTPELQAVGKRAYNRWLADFCGELPGRLTELFLQRRRQRTAHPVGDSALQTGADESAAEGFREEIGPKRSESSTAIGRAPIVKMSRRIPPTPVAAP